MSDTPRTDEQINGKPCTRFEVMAGDSLRNASVQSEFARTLERELNAANDRIRLLIAERDTARLQSDQKVSLREEFRELLGTDDIEQGITVVCDLKQLAAVRLGYIKQLETEKEAANDMFRKLNIHALNLTDRIKRLEDRIRRASIAFFEDGSDASVASGMLVILEEERGKV